MASLPIGWVVDLIQTGDKKSVKIAYTDKHFATDLKSLGDLFVRLKTKPSDRISITNYVKDFIDKKVKKSNAQKPSKPSKDVPVASNSLSKAPTLQSKSTDTYKGVAIEGMTKATIVQHLKDLGVYHKSKNGVDLVKAELSIQLLNAIKSKKKIYKKRDYSNVDEDKDNLKDSDVSPNKVKKLSNNTSMSSSLSSSYNDQPSSSSQIINDDVSSMVFATRNNKGNLGRRRFIDYDDHKAERDSHNKEKKIEREKLEEIKNKKNIRQIAANCGVSGGVLQYFSGNRKGSRGVLKAVKNHSKRGPVFPTLNHVNKFKNYVTSCDPLYTVRRESNKIKIKELYLQWIWLTQLNFNILVYGIGDKSFALKNFAKEYLFDEDVIYIDASTSSKSQIAGLSDQESNFRILLDTLAHDILGYSSDYLESNSETPTSRYLETILEALQTHYTLSSKEKYFLGCQDEESLSKALRSRIQEARQHRLYIILESIEGPLFADVHIHEMLSKLASFPIISLIASTDHINTPLLWSHDSLSRFRWTYHQLSTFECYDISQEFVSKYCNNLKIYSGKDGEMSNHAGLDFLLRSLTPRHREILNLLAEMELSRRESVLESKTDLPHNHDELNSNTTSIQKPSHSMLSNEKWNSIGVYLDSLFDICRQKLIVQNLQGLIQNLREFKDHKVLSYSKPESQSSKNLRKGNGGFDYSDGKQSIIIHLPTSVLKLLVNKE